MGPLATTSTNGQPAVSDLFALGDEKILEIEPEKEMARREARGGSHEPAGKQPPADRSEDAALTGTATAPSSTSHQSPVTSRDATEPPAWLAAQMKDPWGGEEAREFWDGVQQARTAAAAYRAAIASPEDALALKELYPGGVSEARAAAERARLLDEVDRAYFGAPGNSPEQLSASRAQLAQRMLREDPAAFREMVEAGIRVLQEASGSQGATTKSLASLVSDASASASPSGKNASVVGAQHAAPQLGNASANEAHVAAYAAFERAANEDLERSVGAAIERTLAQALPTFEQHNTPGQTRRGEQAGAQRAAPLQERLQSSRRVPVRKTPQGDRQPGAQQLVPGAAKRVLNDWTQTTLAAHRGSTQRADAASLRTEVAPARPEASVPAHPAGNEKAHARQQNAPRSSGQAGATKSQAINYPKLSDEQILDM